MLSRRILPEIEQLSTPFYLYDMELLRRTLMEIVDCSSAYGYKVCYAIKANFEDRIVREVINAGLGIDAVSGNEVRKGIELGSDPQKIVYAGVGKSDAEIRYSIREGIFAFNCESREELYVINSIAGEMGRVVNVALRINPDVEAMTHKHISTGQADSKFGISYKEIEEVSDELGELKNIMVTGLHFHIGSQLQHIQVFEHLCHRVNSMYQWFTTRGFNLTHLNLGGGLAIDYDEPDIRPMADIKVYFGLFHKHLNVPKEIGIYFELGRSVVGQCGELITRVLFNKVNAAGRNIAVIDASMSQLLRPVLYGAKHAVELLTPHGETKKIYTIAGTACESTDILVRDVELPELRRGDLLTIKSAGAYGTSMASRYNLQDLPASRYSDEL